MYYSSGNYEAFAHPRKPEGVDHKSAYLIGSGLAALTAACYLVRDGQMKGERIHIFEKDPIPGGACDGYKYDIGYVMRGGREMDNHFEVMWDLLRSIPSLETEGASVLDEYYWLNKADPNSSLCRATEKQGQDAHTDGKFAISDQGALEIMKLFFTPDEQLQDKKITDVFDEEVFSSNFWLYWRTMFAFENWHSALEMKLYLKRYIHHIGGLPDFTALRFTRYNQYESIILPMTCYLKDHGVQFFYETKVTDVQFNIEIGRKQASSITVDHKGQVETIDLTENDLLFITNGGCVESCTVGAQDKAAGFDPTIKPGNGWDLWRRVAAQDPRSATRISSAPNPRNPTGRVRPSPRWTIPSHGISKKFASGIRSAAIPSRAASSRSRIPVGSSVGRSIANSSSGISPKTSSASGSTACSAISLAIMSRNP